MAVPNRPLGQTKYTEQNMGNTSFDDDFGVNAVEILEYDPTANTLNRVMPANALNLKPFDYCAMVISPTTTETYTFKSGGSSGTTTNTVVIVYTDSTRADISTVTKT
jgi:hypothetical protein